MNNPDVQVTIGSDNIKYQRDELEELARKQGFSEGYIEELSTLELDNIVLLNWNRLNKD